MRVLGPKVLDFQRPPPFREGRDLALHELACSKGAKGVLGAEGGMLQVTHLFGSRGGGGGKRFALVLWSLTGNQPMACTLALWWLKIGPTGRPREGGTSPP